MKSVKWSVAAVLALCLVSGGAMAQWHRHGPSVHFGVVVGPYWDPWYPYPYRYYYPPAVVVEAAPPVYIQQSVPPAAAAAPPPVEYWYYCNEARAYYPYVKECPGGWQKVLPQPR